MSAHNGRPRPAQFSKFKELLIAGGCLRFVGVSSSSDLEISAHWVAMVLGDNIRPHFLISVGNAEPRLFKSIKSIGSFVAQLPEVARMPNVFLPVLPALSGESDLYELTPEHIARIKGI